MKTFFEKLFISVTRLTPPSVSTRKRTTPANKTGKKEFTYATLSPDACNTRAGSSKKQLNIRHTPAP